jgi:hypothetical protein
MEFESKLWCSMSVLVNIKHPHVVNAVAEAALVGTEDLTDFEDDSQLFIIKVIEMRLEQGLEDLFSLVIGNNSCGIPCSNNFFEIFSEQLPILGNKATDAGIVTSVIKGGGGCGLDRELAVSLSDQTESLLPLTQIDDAVLPNVNGIK